MIEDAPPAHAGFQGGGVAQGARGSVPNPERPRLITPVEAREMQRRLQQMPPAQLMQIIRAPAGGEKEEVQRGFAVDALLAGGCSMQDIAVLVEIAIWHYDRMIIDKLARPAYEGEATDAEKRRVEYLISLLESHLRTGSREAWKISVRGLGRLTRPKQRLEEGRCVKQLPFKHDDIVRVLVDCLEHPVPVARQDAAYWLSSQDIADPQERARAVAALQRHCERVAKTQQCDNEDDRSRALHEIDLAIDHIGRQSTQD